MGHGAQKAGIGPLAQILTSTPKAHVAVIQL